MFSHDNGISREDANGVVITQCGTRAPRFTINVSALADNSSWGAVPTEDLTAMINAACE